MPKAPLSGLQKDVLGLYRRCVRAAYRKGPARAEFLGYTREQFQRFRHLSRKDFTTIEYLLRSGHRRLEMLSDATIKHIN